MLSLSSFKGTCALLSIIVITMQEIGNYLAARLDKR